MRANFWSGSWLRGGSAVQDVVPILFTFACHSVITVATALSNYRWVRDIQAGILTRALAEYLKLWDMITDIQLAASQSDEAGLGCTKAGIFSVKSA